MCLCLLLFFSNGFVCLVRALSSDGVCVVFSLRLFVGLYVSVSVCFVFVHFVCNLLCDVVWFVCLCVLCFGCACACGLKCACVC